MQIVLYYKTYEKVWKKIPCPDVVLLFRWVGIGVWSLASRSLVLESTAEVQVLRYGKSLPLPEPYSVQYVNGRRVAFRRLTGAEESKLWSKTMNECSTWMKHDKTCFIRSAQIEVGDAI